MQGALVTSLHLAALLADETTAQAIQLYTARSGCQRAQVAEKPPSTRII